MSARTTLNVMATIADMKLVDYKNTLAITSLIDLLVQKGIITPEEFAETARHLDATSV
ncbi:MAG: hypothetical protein ACM3XM_04520 [Mycobacterium leprae]